MKKYLFYSTKDPFDWELPLNATQIFYIESENFKQTQLVL